MIPLNQDDEIENRGIILISDENIQLKENTNEIILKSSLDSSTIQQFNNDEEGEVLKTITPIPKIKIFAIFIIMLCDAVNGLSMFPYSTFMVKSFNLTDNEKVLGYYIGVLASSYYFSQLFSSFFWGWFSNRFGRRPAVLSGLICSMTCLLGFGMSKYYPMSIIFRFLSGLLNGNVSVAKTMLGEITDSTNQARAFSFIGLSWSIGGIVAPLIGGVTSNVCEKGVFKLNPKSPFILCEFPYLLPNLVCFSLSFVGLMLCYFYLQETLSFKVKNTKNNSNFISNIYKSIKVIWFKFTKNDHKELGTDDADSLSMVSSESINSLSMESEIFNLELEDSNQIEIDDTMSEDYSDQPRSVWELVKDKPVIYSCVIYALLGFSFTIFEECFPVWSSLKRSVNSKTGKADNGGYGFTSVDIGLLSSSAGLFALFIQIFVFPPIVHKLGLVKSFKLSMLIALPSWILLPELSRMTILQPGDTVAKHSPLFWVLLFPCYMFQSFSGEISFISIIVMISNSCMPKDMALVNSIGMFLVSISRTVGPITGSSLLAYTMSHDIPYPLDYHFIYVLEFLLFTSLLLLSHFLLPNTLNFTKEKSISLEEFTIVNDTSSKGNNNTISPHSMNDNNENKI